MTAQERFKLASALSLLKAAERHRPPCPAAPGPCACIGKCMGTMIPALRMIEELITAPAEDSR